MSEPSGAPTVLVIEDDPGIQMTVRLSLEVGGFHVTLASSAEEALELLPGLAPAVILLDVTLPGMDGWSFLAHLRDTDALHDQGIVVMSAHASEEIAARAAEAGAQGHIAKPFDVDELIDLVGKVAAQRLSDPGR